MRRLSLVLITACAFTAACNSGSMTLPDEYTDDVKDEGDDGGSDDDGGQDGGGDTTEPGDGDGDGDNFTGEYGGETEIVLITPQGTSQEFCWGESTWVVEDDGVVSGDSSCEIGGGPLEGETLYLQISGEMSSDGDAWGEVVATRSWTDRLATFEWSAFAFDEGGEVWLETHFIGAMQGPEQELTAEGYGWGEQY